MTSDPVAGKEAPADDRASLLLRDEQGPYARRGMALEFDRFAFFSDAGSWS